MPDGEHTVVGERGTTLVRRMHEPPESPRALWLSLRELKLT